MTRYLASDDTKHVEPEKLLTEEKPSKPKDLKEEFRPTAFEIDLHTDSTNILSICDDLCAGVKNENSVSSTEHSLHSSSVQMTTHISSTTSQLFTQETFVKDSKAFEELKQTKDIKNAEFIFKGEKNIEGDHQIQHDKAEMSSKILESVESSLDLKISEQSFSSDMKNIESECVDSVGGNIQVSKLLAQPHNLEDKTPRKLSIKSELSENPIDDEFSTTTDATASSLTYVSDTFISDSRTDTTTSEDDYLHISTSKVLIKAKDSLQKTTEQPVITKSIVERTTSHTSTKSDVQPSDLSPESNISGAQETQYERSISFSDNAASDVSSDCKFEEPVVNLPYDSEKDELTTDSITRSSSSLSKTQELNKNFKQLTSESRIEHTSSPQSDVTEYTESVSMADSIIESQSLEKRLMEKKMEEKIQPNSPCSERNTSSKKKLRVTEVVLNRQPKALTSYKKPIEKKEKAMNTKSVSTTVKQKPEIASKGTTITKTTTRKTNVVTKSNVDIELTKLSSTTVTKTSSRMYGYMQSTVSRDQKIGKTTIIAQRSASTRSRTDSESRSVEKKSSSIDVGNISETIEIKKDFEVEAKSSCSPSPTKRPSRIIDSNKLREQSLAKKAEKSITTSICSDTDKSSSERSTSIVSMTKSLKDKKNSSLIPVKHQPQQQQQKQTQQTTSKKEQTTTKSASITKSSKQVQKISATTTKASDNKSSVISRKKKKTERATRSDSQDSLDKFKKLEKATASVKTITGTGSSSTRVKKTRVLHGKVTTETTTSKTTVTPADITYRSQSALQYANKDSITFEHGEIASSMPSSPSHVIKRPSSSNGNNVITSEVFTRTVESPKSLEVIYRQPESHLSSKTKYVSDIDASFIETTDSSLSDSIALPSLTSDQDAESKRKNKNSPQSPIATKMPLDLIECKSRKADITPMKHSDKDESDVIKSSSTVNIDTESISPILEFQAISPQRQKHKFSYEKKDFKKAPYSFHLFLPPSITFQFRI
ncbi:hypothetical protein PVAND_010428 [Polypedilum vanderplanki]|uniref:Uncharacterized protein n=1 Tax=Polypedilum vanderplanki TaxID=319348 RepID=A0A9J6CFI2_POLVA|nr:hypothetical protein PVAND_010428 [Polypedilum vanderplanki]